VISRLSPGAGAEIVSRLAIVTDRDASKALRTKVGTGRVRFPLVRWLLAPRTTWQARRLPVDFGEGMDAKTAWVMARLARHPDELGYAMAHLDDERRAAD
jgi:hypothetical protein